MRDDAVYIDSIVESKEKVESNIVEEIERSKFHQFNQKCSFKMMKVT